MRQETAKIPRDENSGLKPCSQQTGANPELLEIWKQPVHRQTGQQGAAWCPVLSQGNIFQAAPPPLAAAGGGLRSRGFALRVSE